VFVSRTGSPHDHRNIGGRVLARAVKEAKLDAPAPTFHDLRHTHASRLIAAGMDVQSVADRLGHANISVTQSTYAHEFDAAARSPERRAMLEAIDGKPMEGTDGSSGQQTAPLEGSN
jgi:integrase